MNFIKNKSNFDFQQLVTRQSKSTSIAIVTSLLCLVSCSMYGNSQAELEEAQQQLAMVQDNYEQLTSEFESFKTENNEYITPGKELVQQKQKLVEQANTAVTKLEQNKQADLIAAALEAVNQLPASAEKDELTKRIEAAKQTIEKEAKLKEAEASVSHLEANQTREQLGATSNIVNALPESDRKNQLTQRIAAVTQAIEQREAQEKAAAEQAQAQQAQTEQQAPATSVYYPNCSAVRAAGAAPLYQGEPGYAPHLDRDKDGIACE